LNCEERKNKGKNQKKEKILWKKHKKGINIVAF